MKSGCLNIQLSQPFFCPYSQLFLRTIFYIFHSTFYIFHFQLSTFNHLFLSRNYVTYYQNYVTLSVGECPNFEP